MAVEPLESEGVIPHSGNIFEFELDAACFDKFDVAAVTLACRAWAIAAQKRVRVDALMAVGPVDFGDGGAAGRPNCDATD